MKTNKRSTEQSFYSHTELGVSAFQIINHVIGPLVHHRLITIYQGTVDGPPVSPLTLVDSTGSVAKQRLSLSE